MDSLNKRQRLTPLSLTKFLSSFADVLLNVLQFVKVKDIVTASTVSKKWNSLWGGNCVWLQLFKRRHNVALRIQDLPDKLLKQALRLYHPVPSERLVRRLFATHAKGIHPVAQFIPMTRNSKSGTATLSMNSTCWSKYLQPKAHSVDSMAHFCVLWTW